MFITLFCSYEVIFKCKSVRLCAIQTVILKGRITFKFQMYLTIFGNMKLSHNKILYVYLHFTKFKVVRFFWDPLKEIKCKTA